MTKLEEVARAIYSAYAGPEPLSDWNRISARDHEMHRKLARAAIEALREPTEEMEAAGRKETEAAFDAGACASASIVYCDMIDVILSNTKEGD